MLETNKMLWNTDGRAAFWAGVSNSDLLALRKFIFKLNAIVALHTRLNLLYAHFQEASKIDVEIFIIVFKVDLGSLLNLLCTLTGLNNFNEITHLFEV